MKILVFTTAFASKVSDIERLTEILGREWTVMGHEMCGRDGDAWPSERLSLSHGPSRRLHNVPQMEAMARHSSAEFSLTHTPLALIGAERSF
jgi:hypothetical protein